MGTLQWRHNEHNGVSIHRHLNYLINGLFRRRSKKTLKLCVTGLCEGNPPVTGGFPHKGASNAENVSIWWLHHSTRWRKDIRGHNDDQIIVPSVYETGMTGCWLSFSDNQCVQSFSYTRIPLQSWTNTARCQNISRYNLNKWGFRNIRHNSDQMRVSYISLDWISRGWG